MSDIGLALTVGAILATLYGAVWALSQVSDWVEKRRAVSTIPPSRTPEITSSRAPDVLPIASPPRTDAGTDGRTPMIAPELKSVSLDTVRSLRAHGYTRDDARALLRGLGWSMGNNTWADAAPPAPAADDDDHITPYAGRRTKASYYPENPELEYAEPTS